MASLNPDALVSPVYSEVSASLVLPSLIYI